MSERKISRKQVLGLGGAGLGLAALGRIKPSFGQSRPTGDRPNILFITVDQLCSLADVPSILPLPNIRRLVSQGTEFRQYHVHQAPCGPSRSIIYTGQYVQKTGVYTNPPGEYARVAPGPPAIELPQTFMTVGKMLREQGYYTAYKGKWHLSMVNQRAGAAVAPRAYPDATRTLEPYGFSDYAFDGETSGMTWAGYGHDGVIAAEAIGVLKKFSRGSTKGKPWYFAVNFINPHDIMFYAPEDDEDHPQASAIGVAMPPPLVAPYDAQWNVPLPASYYKDDLSTKPRTQRGNNPYVKRRDEAGWRTYRNYYFNCIRDVDQHIGQLLAALERFGLASNTIVFLTADHGEQNGAHGLGGKGGTMYKETLRVPLIARGPGVPQGKATNALAGSVDLTPTMLSLAGADEAARRQHYPDLHGVDLSPVLRDPAARTARDKRGILFDFLSAPGGGPGEATGAGVRTQLRGVFDGRYKFARYFNIHEHHTPTDWDTLLAHNDLELYDTRSDPDEIVNLAAQPASQRELILSLNAKVNQLIAEEVGADDGSIYPGGRAEYQLKL